MDKVALFNLKLNVGMVIVVIVLVISLHRILRDLCKNASVCFVIHKVSIAALLKQESRGCTLNSGNFSIPKLLNLGGYYE